METKERFEVWFDGASKRWKLEGTQLEVVIENFKYEGDALKEAKRLNVVAMPYQRPYGRKFKEDAKRAIRKLLRTSNDALDTTYITDSQTGQLLPVPKGNNTKDFYYNLALIEAEKAIDVL